MKDDIKYLDGLTKFGVCWGINANNSCKLYHKPMQKIIIPVFLNHGIKEYIYRFWCPK